MEIKLFIKIIIARDGQNQIFRVTNFNEVTNRCYIEPVSPLPGLNITLPPQELVSITEIENAE